MVSFEGHLAVARWLCFAALAALSACSQEVDCRLGTTRSDGGSCDCPEGSAWVPAKALCEPLGDSDGVGSVDGHSDGAARVDVDSATRVDRDAGFRDADPFADGAKSDDGGPDATNLPDASSTVVDADTGPACVSSTEICNGKDDDCDTLIDEDVSDAPLGESCSNGGAGVCAASGKYVCSAGTPVCNAPPPTPVPEICDGVDNDCQNGVDDTFADKGKPCTAGTGDCQGTGVYECDPADPTKLRCTAVEKPKNACGTSCGPVPVEDCDGVDDDCDGQIDESVKNACGACGAVPVEACDGTDNDCDGVIDDGVGTAWYPDCDADGYAGAGAAATTACAVAPPLQAGCSAWTKQAPGAGTTDCKAADPTYHPGAAFDVTDATGDGDLNCDGVAEKKWPFSSPDLRLDSYFMSTSGAWNGAFKMCDLRVNGVVQYPSGLADFATRGQCPCYVEWEGGDVNTGHLKFEVADIPCTSSDAETVRSLPIRQLVAGTCQPTGDLSYGVQRCR